MRKIAIIDYGGSNLRSVFKALDRVSGRNAKITVSSNINEIKQADKMVFPGQGAIGNCMERLRRNGLDNVIKDFCNSKPFFGICLGLQSLMSNSEEDNGTKCLGILDGIVKRFEKPTDLSTRNGAVEKIPHMGWNNVLWQRSHPLIEGIPNGTRFYFVHSYFVPTSIPRLAISKTKYLGEFSSSVGLENIFATQFHPEKSSVAGLQLLENFIHWEGNEPS